ncbi:hypothetical protein [Comamonas sp. GB3 AK4-5]|uniref:hypothetical protein n=1 Tax=Comamonas sp. GB3 AK4-5 TaxID=3231487 RepID=UPI00351ED9B9
MALTHTTAKGLQLALPENPSPTIRCRGMTARRVVRRRVVALRPALFERNFWLQKRLL